jgi:hypothetical protein
MATLVKNIKSGKCYYLLGASYSFYKDTVPSFFGGNLFPNEEEGEFKIAAVCNELGEIEWFLTEEIIVVEVDGIKVSELININNQL